VRISVFPDDNCQFTVPFVLFNHFKLVNPDSLEVANTRRGARRRILKDSSENLGASIGSIPPAPGARWIFKCSDVNI